MNSWSKLIAGVAIVVVGYGLYLYFNPEPEPPIAPQVDQGAAGPRASGPISPFPEPPAPPPPAVQYPMEPAPAESAAPAAPEASDVDSTLAGLLGRDTVLAFLNLDRFFIRVVATVDNLGREQASPAVWPVHPTPGRFTTSGAPPEAFIDPANYARYQGFVEMISSTDTGKAFEFYKQWYPQFQKAYEELGYPKGYFNDRLVTVIDILLATPDVQEPIRVDLPGGEGQAGLTHPWLRVEFADRNLRALPAGQKLLLRMGPDNRKAIKAKLADFRRRITQFSASR